MKKKKIVEIVNEHLKEIRHFGSRDYHVLNDEKTANFIITVKQLKSFFHLLDIQSAEEPVLRISRRMKLLYDYAEALHGLQFHIQEIISYCETWNEEIPVLYISRIEEEVASWRKKAENFIRANNDSKEDDETIMEMLPRELSTSSIRKYLDYVFYQLSTLFDYSYKDESLHGIKKLLEELFYNWDFTSAFLEQKDDFFNKRNIKMVIELLDNYYKKCEDVALLNMYDSAVTATVEKDTLDRISYSLKQEMESLKSNILQCLQVMEIRAASRRHFNTTPVK